MEAAGSGLGAPKRMQGSGFPADKSIPTSGSGTASSAVAARAHILRYVGNPRYLRHHALGFLGQPSVPGAVHDVPSVLHGSPPKGRSSKTGTAELQKLYVLDAQFIGGAAQDVVRADLEDIESSGGFHKPQRAPFGVEHRP